MHCVKSIAIAACFTLVAGLISAPAMHVHPAEASGASPIVHSHINHLHLKTPGGATQIEKTDDHSRAVYLTDFCLLTQAHVPFIALASQALEFVPLKAVAQVIPIEQRAHDPPIFSPTHPRSPPA